MVATIFGGLASTESRRERKLTARRVLAVTTEDAAANPSYHPWSEVPITSGWISLTQGISPSSSMQPSRKCFFEKCSSTVGPL